MNRDVDRHNGRRRLIIRSVEWEFAYFHKYRYFLWNSFPNFVLYLETMSPQLADRRMYCQLVRPAAVASLSH